MVHSVAVGCISLVKHVFVMHTTLGMREREWERKGRKRKGKNKRHEKETLSVGERMKV